MNSEMERIARGASMELPWRIEQTSGALGLNRGDVLDAKGHRVMAFQCTDEQFENLKRGVAAINGVFELSKLVINDTKGNA